MNVTPDTSSKRFHFDPAIQTAVRLKHLLILPVLFTCLGCSSVVFHKLNSGAQGSEKVVFYPGIRADVHVMAESGNEFETTPHRVAFLGYGLMDFPFSLVADTVLFPIDLVRYSLAEDSVEKK